MIIATEVRIEDGSRVGSFSDLFSSQTPDGAWVRLYDGVPRRPHHGFCAEACDSVPTAHHLTASGYDEANVSVAAYRNAFLLPSALAVTQDACLVAETTAKAKWKKTSLCDVKDFTCDSDGRLSVLPSLIDRATAVSGNALWFYSQKPLIFGHWLSDALTSLSLVAPAIRSGQLRVIVPASLGHWADTLLDCIGLPKEVRLHRTNESLRCSTLLVSSSSDGANVFRPNAVLRNMARALRSRFGSRFGKADGSLRLFVVRPAAGTTSARNLINEQEVFEALVPLGFRAIEPSSLTIRRQIRVFSRAEIVVGLHGSAFANLLFCHPRTSLLDIVPADQMYFGPWTLNLTNLMGHRYAHVFARRIESREKRGGWLGTVDSEAVRRSVKLLLAQPKSLT